MDENPIVFRALSESDKLAPLRQTCASDAGAGSSHGGLRVSGHGQSGLGQQSEDGASDEGTDGAGGTVSGSDLPAGPDVAQAGLNASFA